MSYKRLEEITKYEQPTKYIVYSNEYKDNYDTPVLTAGKSFILGYTNDTDGIYMASPENPVIIFDDFTTDLRYVDFPFKVKSSAIKFITSDKYNLKYLYHAMKNMNFNADTHKRYWISEFSKLTVPDIPINEQKFIAEKLDLIDNQILLLENSNHEIDKMYNASFMEYFGNPDDNKKGYEVGTINDVCSSIVRGPFGSSLKKEFFVEKSIDTYKVYEQKNAIQKNEKLGNYYITKEKFDEMKRFEVKSDDIIMSCSGTMGELYQLPKKAEAGIINQALCKFTLNNKLTPNYFMNYFSLTLYRLDTRGSSIKNIASVKYVKELPIIIPPIEVQKDYEKIVGRLNEIKDINNKKIEKYKMVYDNIINKYFN